MNKVPLASRQAGFLVLSAGMFTAGLSLVVQWYAAEHDFNIMGFYVNGILPLGAIGLGLVAGTGYALAALLTNAKVTRALLCCIVLLQVLAYVCAQYLEYVMVCENLKIDISFWTYFDAVTRSIAFKGHNDKPGDPLGVFGYGIRLLEIIGFAAAGPLFAGIVMSLPYCDACNRYKRCRKLAAIAAGPVRKKRSRLKGDAVTAYATACRVESEKADAAVQALVMAMETGSPTAFVDSLIPSRIAEKTAKSLSAYVTVMMQQCPSCSAGAIVLTITRFADKFADQGPHIQTLDTFPVTADFACGVLGDGRV